VKLSYVVTGGAHGVGRAVVEKPLADGHAVVVLDLDPAAMAWISGSPDSERMDTVIGSAADVSITEAAATAAGELGTFAGWVNNAAVIRDAILHEAGAGKVLDIITANVAPAVDYGPRGIRVNAVALASIETDRYRDYLAGQSAESAAEIEAQMSRLHPLGRVGLATEVAATGAFLLSDDAGFINGAVQPVDGGRSVWGPDPEET
jgi:NAD(P)-dependent dehydrogenase (short-subunit alcohol dehydrogenase family)